MDGLVGACVEDLRPLCPGADDHALEEVATDLVGRWTSPHRRYHSVRHLLEVLAAVVALGRAGEAQAPDLLLARVAAWYHDAVHEGRAPGADEEASAALAVDQLDRLGAPVDVIERVASLVLATCHHEPVDDPAGRVLLDADLWVLGAPEARFDDYCRQVREEFAEVPDQAYAAARGEILRGLLGHDHLYATATARATWEAAARANVERELARLA